MFAFDFTVYGLALGAALLLAGLAWLVSLPLRNVSIVDSLWSIFFLLMALVFTVLPPAGGERTFLVLFLVAVWASRLSLYITVRNWGEGEDRRYQAIRAENQPGFWWKSLYLVFGLQAVLAWIIALPLMVAMTSSNPLGWWDALALLLWAVGFGFEAVGDRQLARFKADPANRGKVLDTGLWRYTRHPNYFGEACLWWGFFVFAVAAGGWWTILSPLLMTFLLLRVSGVRLLERDIGERRPAYRDYIARTHAFFPGPPRRARSRTS